MKWLLSNSTVSACVAKALVLDTFSRAVRQSGLAALACWVALALWLGPALAQTAPAGATSSEIEAPPLAPASGRGATKARAPEPLASPTGPGPEAPPVAGVAPLAAPTPPGSAEPGPAQPGQAEPSKPGAPEVAEAPFVPAPDKGSARPSTLPAAGQAPSSESAEVVVFNRSIIVFRAPFLGVTPEQRVKRAEENIQKLLARGGPGVVERQANPLGAIVTIDGALVFGVVPGDVDPLAQEGLNDVAERACKALRAVIEQTREARDMRALSKALVHAGIATGAFLFLLVVLWRAARALRARLTRVALEKSQSLKIGNAALIEGQQLLPWVRRTFAVIAWGVALALGYHWSSFVLGLFPYTRPWGERIDGYLVDVATGILQAMVESMPGIGVALAIFVIARFFVGVVKPLLARLASAEGSTWLTAETLPTTQRLISLAVGLFAVAMAYPYLPGAQTDAFKGLSVLLGLMVSMGAANVLGQGAAGLILTYTRTFTVGEYVRIGDHEGTVTATGVFTTRMRTGLGEELTFPNSIITQTVTKNYSRVVKGRGFILDTVVTIGYDTPWRQVEAMLVEAARRTPGVVSDPHPRVFQTGLSDYYPEYRLVCHAIPAEPLPRAVVLSELHRNVQDVFNQYGVQIMSPHYMMDPAQAKVVPRKDWYLAPAKAPEPAPEVEALPTDQTKPAESG